jgi:hypothetical protein
VLEGSTNSEGDIKGLKDLILSGGGIGPSSASDKAKAETFSIADDGSLVDRTVKKSCLAQTARPLLKALTDVEDFRLLFAAPSGDRKQRESMSK